MQIYCQRFFCHKAVEVCYWSCKFRGKCLDWQKALKESPGIDAISERLAAASKKSGRAYEPTDLVIITSAKKKAEV